MHDLYAKEILIDKIFSSCPNIDSPIGTPSPNKLGSYHNSASQKKIGLEESIGKDSVGDEVFTNLEARGLDVSPMRLGNESDANQANQMMNEIKNNKIVFSVN